jgi:hypothetical protein
MKQAALGAMGYLREQIELAKTDWKNFQRDIGALWDRITGGVPAKAIAEVFANAVPPAQRIAESFVEIEKSAKGAAAAIETIVRPPAAQTFAGGASGKSTMFPGKEDRDALRAAMEEMQGQIRLADIAFNSAQEHANASVRMWGSTEAQKTAILLAEIDKRERLQLELVAKQSEYETDLLAAQQRVVNESLLIEAQAAAKRQQILDESLRQQATQWQSMLTPIQSAFDSQLRGLLAGTTSWAQATKAIVSDLVLDVIRWLEKIAIEKAALALASNFAAPPINAGAIGADLGQAYAGFAAYLAPFLGPAAPEAAAGLTATVAAGAAAFSVPSLDIGGVVNAQGMALVHAGEAVIPAARVSPLGPEGGSSHTFNMSFNMQGRLIYSELVDNARTIAKLVQQHVNLNPSRA